MDRVLIDGLMVAHRCYRAMDDLQTEAGVKTGIEYGFLRIMEMLEREYKGAKLIVCWDCPTAKARRQKIAPYYKESRGKRRSDIPSSFHERVHIMRDLMLDQRWCWCASKGMEADDLMHTLAKTNGEGTSYIYTNDRDLLQSVVDDTIIMVKSRMSGADQTWHWNEEKIWEEFRVRPWQLPLYRAVIGDKSDDLPGFGKLGKAKTAEYVRAVYRTDCVELTPTTLFEMLVWEDAHRYTQKVLDGWKEFADKYFVPNFEVMRLTVIDGVSYAEPGGVTESQKIFLKSKEIRSLNLCRELLAEDFKEEEF